MAYARGKFGVEYQPVETETHHLRGLVLSVLVIAGAAFAWYKITSRQPAAEPPPGGDSPGAVSESPVADPGGGTPGRAEANGGAPELPRPQPSPTAAPEVRPLLRQLLDSEAARPKKDQVLIRRYSDAETQGNLRNAKDAIQKLYNSPSMADLRDPLMRRLGDLNMQMLVSGKPTTWTNRATVKRGDSRDRIAREYRTTPAAMEKLNPGVKWERIRPGDVVTVLYFPNAVLVVHKQLGYADLSMRNEFFRRYYLATSKSARCDVYQITNEAGATTAARFRELGIRLSRPDREELEMFMTSGARITVTEQ